ncbi:hypothetical protein BD779DRAFT_1436109 [Infundibulicybe gibba]|nr:hypothetical protein BD779DRAFT_1436109 [Infundibulicybe gibba]
MVSATTNAFLGLAGWSVIPDFATQQLLRILHHIAATVFHVVPPQAGTPSFRRHYAITFAVVVLGYLLFNMVESARAMPPNFYQILGVAPAVDDAGLKAAFRQFAKKNHPDRPEVGPAGEELFMVIRDVFEALKDPVVRFAYDRFGAGVLAWTDCSTTRDYLRHGILQSSGYYIVVGAGLLFWSAIGQPSPISFWRFTLFAATLATEMALLLSPSPSSSAAMNGTILHFLFPARVAYQHILFLHQLFMFLSVALSRVAPQLFPDTSKQQERAAIEKLTAMTAFADREVSLMLHAQLHSIHPFPTSATPVDRASLARMRPVLQPAPEIMDMVAAEIEDLVIEANVKKDAGPLRGAWEAAVRRGEHGGSAETEPVKQPRNFWEAEQEEVDDEPPTPTNAALELEKDEGVVVPADGAPEYPTLPSPRPSPPPGLSPTRRASAVHVTEDVD